MEPGQRAWLARQQRAWRRGTLLHEQVLLLALSGCHLELYDAAEWRQTAHDVAAYLMGCQIQPVRLGFPSHLNCIEASTGRMLNKIPITLWLTTTWIRSLAETCHALLQGSSRETCC